MYTASSVTGARKKNKKNNSRIYHISLFIHTCFWNNTLRDFITDDESSLSLMINVQTVHKYTIKERLSVCDCNCNFLIVSIQLFFHQILVCKGPDVCTNNLKGDDGSYGLNVH